MRWIVGASQRFRLIVAGVAVAIMALGAVQLREAKVDVLPEFSPTVVQVQTEALGLSSGEVERLVTTPLEKTMLNGVAFVDEINSESITSLSSIELVFEPGTDPMDARQLVQERLALATALPHVSRTPEMLQPLSSSNRVLMAELSATEVSQMELSVLARWRIRPRLMGVPGVANVAVWANRDRQLQVQVDPDRLAANDVTLQQVVESTANALWFSPLTFVEASTPGTGGFIDGPNQRLPVRHILPIRTAGDLAQVAIDGTGGSLRLGDVAEVVEEHQPLIGDAVTDGDPGLMLVVEKLPGASTLEVTKGVEAALAEMAPGLAGVEIDTTVFRPASFVESALSNLGLALLLGGLLLIAVLAAGFAGWRGALVALLSIVLAAFTAGLVLQLLGATFNAVLLAGLVMALALIVDEAVAGVHGTLRRRREAAGADAHSSLVEAALAVRGPLVFGTLIVAATAAPLLLLGGTAGAFYRELAIAYLVAVAVAMVAALTVTPALSALLLSGPAGDRESPLVRPLRRGYEAALARVVRRPVPSYAAVAALVAVGVAVLPALASPALLPSMQDRDLLVTWQAAPGTSHPEMMRITASAAEELRAIPGVRRVGAHVGRAVTSDQTTEIDAGQLWLSIDRSADYQATTEAVREVVHGYPGIRAAASTYPEELIRQAAESVTEDLVVRVYGDDLAVLRDKAEEVREAVATVDGVSSPRVELVDQTPTLEIEVDLTAAERSGIKPGDVRRAAATLVQGIQVGNLFEDQKVFDVMVWGVPALRHSVTDIGNLEIETPGGDGIRLGDVAEVRVAANPSVLRHEATSRYLDVSAGVSGRDRGAVVDEVRSRIQQIAFPLEHHAEVVDESAQRPTDLTRILWYGLAAAVVAFLLLQSAFASWRLTALLFWVLPAAAAGGMVAIALTGGDPTIGSVAGLVAVVGISARWLLLMVSQIGRREQEHASRDPELVVRAAGDRFAPVAMTALGVTAAVLPLLVMGGAAGLEVLRPLAVTLIGGLLVATALTLFVVPTLCARYGAHHTDAGLEPGGRQTTEGEMSHA